MKSQKCTMLGICVFVVLVVQISCQSDYQRGFENVHGGVNNHSGTATYNYTIPTYEHPPNHFQTTLAPQHPVTHKVTQRTTARRSPPLLPIILQTGFNEAPSALYQYSPLYKSSTEYALGSETKKKFDVFMRNHIKNMREKARHDRLPIPEAKDYYFVSHTHYNKAYVNKLSISNRTFGRCEDQNTSSVICLPNSKAICSDSGIILCITLLQQCSPCVPYSLDYCIDAILPCATDDLQCIASRQEYKPIKVPCRSIRTMTNNVVAKYTIPRSQFDIDPNAICITVAVEPKLFKSPVGYLADMGIQVAQAYIDVIQKATTLPPPSVSDGVTKPITLAIN